MDVKSKVSKEQRRLSDLASAIFELVAINARLLAAATPHLTPFERRDLVRRQCAASAVARGLPLWTEETQLSLLASGRELELRHAARELLDRLYSSKDPDDPSFEGVSLPVKMWASVERVRETLEPDPDPEPEPAPEPVQRFIAGAMVERMKRGAP